MLWSPDPVDREVAAVVARPAEPARAPVPPPVDRVPEGIQYWYGRATGSWFAIVPWPWARCGVRLVESASEGALAAEVRRLLVQVG
ncbi:hypothetical protein AGRA3207_000529 [Actinomadura graeca]|uniref:Uncharacterized protein n=1 Tax=Actinomadura graeca TaxID=2750812 RepID=A0ABX8QML2_9ACTN|nr:hypothetical protein [Actinomadura graeca]QXJ19918.1 hypothetical protein AGRA3207_000529 [Actinomadura graeca]